MRALAIVPSSDPYGVTRLVSDCAHATSTAHFDHHLISIACALREQGGPTGRPSAYQSKLNKSLTACALAHRPQFQLIRPLPQHGLTQPLMGRCVELRILLQ